MTRSHPKPPYIRVDPDWDHYTDVRLIKARATINDARFAGRTFELSLTEDGAVLSMCISVDPDRADDEDISARQAREIPLGALAKEIRRVVLIEGTAAAERAGLYSSPALKQQYRLAAWKATPDRRRPAVRDDRFYAELAHEFIQSRLEGLPREEALERVGQTFGRKASTVHGDLKEAKRRGLYQGPGRGRTGGARLTPEGLAALKEND